MKRKTTIGIVVVCSILCFCFSCQKKSAGPESSSSAKTSEPSQAALPAKPASTEELGKNLVEATWSGDSGEVQRLLKAGADVNAKDSFGFTALMRAAERGYVEFVKTLLQAGADIKVKRENGWTALQDACSANQLEALKVLLEAGADPNERAQDGTGIMFWPAGYGFPEIVRALVKAGAKIDDPIDHFGTTPLMLAVRNQKAETVKVLLELGAQVNAKDTSGKTALAFAKEIGQTEIVEILTKAGGKD